MTAPTRWGLSVPFGGVALAAQPELYRRAEALGYDDLWSAEGPNGTDGFTPLAVAAAVTERIRLGTGIVNPFTRGPGLLAQSAATLQESSGGRFVLGLGASSDVIVERFNDGVFQRPYSRVREAVERLRPVLSVPAEKGFGGLRLERPVTTPVPIMLAALRGRMLGLAGAIAEGAFTNLVPLPSLGQVVAAHRAGEARAGRPEGATELVCRLFAYPGDTEAGLAAAAPVFATYAGVPVYEAFFRWLGYGEQLEPMLAALRAGDRAEAYALAPRELLREIFLFGSPEKIRERARAFVDGGVSTVVLAPSVADPADWPGLMEALAP